MIVCQDHSLPADPLESPPLRGGSSQRTEHPPIGHTAELPSIDTEPACSIRNILVPTDISACSLAAVARAAALARHHDATLTLLHVVYQRPGRMVRELESETRLAA
jgi:hypothetical protein